MLGSMLEGDEKPGHMNESSYNTLAGAYLAQHPPRLLERNDSAIVGYCRPGKPALENERPQYPAPAYVARNQ